MEARAGDARSEWPDKCCWLRVPAVEVVVSLVIIVGGRPPEMTRTIAYNGMRLAVIILWPERNRRQAKRAAKRERPGIMAEGKLEWCWNGVVEANKWWRWAGGSAIANPVNGMWPDAQRPNTS